MGRKNCLAKIELRGLGHLVANINVNYCCIPALSHAKMLKETEAEETIGIFCHIFITGGILIGRGAGPLARRMDDGLNLKKHIWRVVSTCYANLRNFAELHLSLYSSHTEPE